MLHQSPVLSQPISWDKNENVEGTPPELVGSLDQLLHYADIASERAELFRSQLNAFRQLRDQSIFNQETRKMRQVITEIFYEIYGAVFKRSLAENNNSRLYKMFLLFGYMDERLLKPEETAALYELCDQVLDSEVGFVYSLPGWLTKIYQLEKDPSINEFGLDYHDVFREKKKRGELSEQDRGVYEHDVDGRLQHEIDNLVKMGQRLCYGRMNDYIPVLHSGMITRDLRQTMVTRARIEASMSKVLSVDFSAFYREIMYHKPEKGIHKQLVMKSVWPDIILMPTFGCRAVMWQELTGRVRDSAGRFLLPIFTAENLDDLMIDVIAKFRWELSRTMTSSVRENARDDSLVGEYADYIQFYKKNHDLSSDAKEKLRVQVERNRGNVEEIFASDYHTWINYESQGLLRLNKVARGIMFKYCPFSSRVRNNLQKRPLFSDYITRFNNMRAKELKVIEARYSKMVKNGHPLDPNLRDNLMFYQM